MRIGLASDVAAGPDALDVHRHARRGDTRRRALELTGQADRSLAVRPIDWLRLGTLGGAAVLGLEERIGSVEIGKEADLIAIDPRMTHAAARRRRRASHRPMTMLSRLIFRPHPNMVRGAWVRGRLLAGPPGVEAIG